MKRSQIVIIVVLAILTCVSPSVVSAEIPPFQWVKIGVAPYNPNGKVELDLAAVTEFVRKGELSQDEGAEFATLIRASRFEKSSLHRGRVCRAMLSRDKKLDKPVETAWEHYQAVDAKLYKLVNGLELYVVDRCGNPLICDAEEKTKEALPAKAAEPKPAPPVAVREARVGVIPSTAAIPQFRLIVSLFADREDHFFRNRYNAAKQQPSNKTAYRIQKGCSGVRAQGVDSGASLPFARQGDFQPVRFRWRRQADRDRSAGHGCEGAGAV